MIHDLADLLSNPGYLKESNEKFIHKMDEGGEMLPFKNSKECLENMEQLDKIIKETRGSESESDFLGYINARIKKNRSWKNRLKIIWRVLRGESIWQIIE